MKKIRRDDQVIVLAGKDKGRQGQVVRVTEKGAYVSGINMVKRHTKPNPMLKKAAEIVTKEAPIAISNIAIVNNETGKADRIGFRFEEVSGEKSGNDKAKASVKKVRYYKSTGKVIG